MDDFIDPCFERVEKALSALIDSISKYNPSTTHADALVEADKELHKGLQQVQIHQNNTQRIRSLRSGVSILDGQIRSTLLTLSSTRKDLKAAATTVFPPGPTNPINYDELLSFARRISKTTIPSTGMVNSLDSTAAGTGTGTGTATAADSTPVENTTAGATPAGVTTASSTPAALPNGAGASSQQQPQSQPSTSQQTALPESFTQYLNPRAGQVFVPWPESDQLLQGALSANQQLLEQGITIENYDPEAEKRKAEEQRAAAEAEKAAREDEIRKQHEEAQRRAVAAQKAREEEMRENIRRGSVAGGLPADTAEKKASQFQFRDLDDEDDD